MTTKQTFLGGMKKPLASTDKQPTVQLPHGAQCTGKIEWYTPRKYIDSAVSVMGGIDLDPASSDVAQKVIEAKTYYTIEDDGLSHPWKGRVWLNPPYAAIIIRKFVDKLIAHLMTGDVTQAIMLTHNNVDTLWFHKAADVCSALCLTLGRVRFYDESGSGNSPTHGHAFMYFGNQTRKFAKEFRRYGSIWLLHKSCTGEHDEET